MKSVVAFLKKAVRRLLPIEKFRAMGLYWYDCHRFLVYSGTGKRLSQGSLQSRIIMYYHVVEKGLTMPNRHLAFGKDVIRGLMKAVNEYMRHFGTEDAQVRHAVGVVREYQDLHLGQKYDMSLDSEYWKSISQFLLLYRDIRSASQKHVTRGEFYAATESPFPLFAHSRHCVRNYISATIPMERIQKAVEIALTTPSACNRQYCKVHCLPGEKSRELLEIQGGNRGFGHLADKVLVVTASLENVFGPNERNDIFVNGGMFLMNLCYALHYCKIAHCILTWAKSIDCDMRARTLIGPSLREDETIIALISCGEAPEEFGLADSPRKSLNEVFVNE